MKEIGGYFELELQKSEEYHNGALRLNTGRNSVEYILRAKGYKKIYIPYYTCEVILEPINKLNISYQFYYIDIEFRPDFDFSTIEKDAVFLYTNYFGICDHVVDEIAKQCDHLIIDNSQSFFSSPLPKVDTFYSARKFFGVPDGAYLYTDEVLNQPLETDISYQRFEHLLGRIDLGAEKFYHTYKCNDELLMNQSLKNMSVLTQKLLSSINYQSVAEARRFNFEWLHAKLSETNQLNINNSPGAIPMVYPYLVKSGEQLKKKLIENKVYIATYWPNVLEWSDKASLEHKLTQELVPLPIDQRYNKEDLEKYLEIIF